MNLLLRPRLLIGPSAIRKPRPPLKPLAQMLDESDDDEIIPIIVAIYARGAFT